MQPSTRFYALQAFALFAGLQALARGPLVWPWLATPIGWKGMALGAVEHGIIGAVLVTAIAWIYYRLIAPRAQN